MDFRVARFPKIRSFPSPPAALRNLADRAPQVEAFAGRTLERMHPALDWLYNYRRRFATCAVVFVVAWMLVHVVFGANGTAIYEQKKSEYQTLEKEIVGLRKDNDWYSQEIKGLQSDRKIIEKEAREQLHYVKPGEIIYISPGVPQAAVPSSHTAER